MARTKIVAIVVAIVVVGKGHQHVKPPKRWQSFFIAMSIISWSRRSGLDWVPYRECILLGETFFERSIARPSGRSSDRSIEGSIDLPSDRSIDLRSDRSSDRAIDRATERSTERPSDWATDPSRAPSDSPSDPLSARPTVLRLEFSMFFFSREYSRCLIILKSSVDSLDIYVVGLSERTLIISFEQVNHEQARVVQFTHTFGHKPTHR